MSRTAVPSARIGQLQHKPDRLASGRPVAARYADHGFIALDVTPARFGAKTRMVLRFISQQGQDLDRVVFTRVAGESGH